MTELKFGAVEESIKRHIAVHEGRGHIVGVGFAVAEIEALLAIRAAQIDESWRQAIRDLRDMAIDAKSREIDRRCLDLILLGPQALSQQHRP